MSEGLDLSVVIPSLGRPRVLQNTLEDLVRQHHAPLEVLIIAQDIITAESAQRHATDLSLNVIVEPLMQPNASLARNRGLQTARGEIVLFLDDDVQINSPKFLNAHLANYQKPEVPGVAGQILAPGENDREERHSRSLHPRVGWLYFPRDWAERTTVREAPTGNLSVRRTLALAVGGMDAQFHRGAHREDSDFTLRLTQRYGLLIFDPEASLVHLGEPEGGCRSWGSNRGIHPLHHVTGEWYFIAKNLRAGTILFRDLPDHLFVLIRRQILNRSNLTHPWRVVVAALRSAQGLGRAVSKLRQGPKHLAACGTAEAGAPDTRESPD